MADIETRKAEARRTILKLNSWVSKNGKWFFIFVEYNTSNKYSDIIECFMSVYDSNKN